MFVVPIDRIEAHEPWSYLRGSMTIVPAECVTSPISGKVECPETRILDAVFWTARLLVLASTEFTKNGNLTGLHDISFGTLPQPGEIVQVKTSVVRHVWTDVIFRMDVSSSNHFIARGDFTMEEVQSRDEEEVERWRSLWSSLLASKT